MGFCQFSLNWQPCDLLNEDIELAQVVRETNELVESANLNGENMISMETIYLEILAIHLQVRYVELPVC